MINNPFLRGTINALNIGGGFNFGTANTSTINITGAPINGSLNVVGPMSIGASSITDFVRIVAPAPRIRIDGDPDGTSTTYGKLNFYNSGGTQRGGIDCLTDSASTTFTQIWADCRTGGGSQGYVAILTSTVGTLSEKMRILGTGSVGINVTAPKAPLELYDGINYFQIGTATGGYMGLNMGATSTNVSAQNYVLASANGDTLLNSYGGGSNALRFRIGNSDKVLIDGNGKMGVGTIPTYELDVLGASLAAIRITANDDPVIRMYSTNASTAFRNWAIETNSASAGDFVIWQSATSGADPRSGSVRLYINPSGNLAVGTTVVPASRVAYFVGNIEATGSVIGAVKSFNIPHPLNPGMRLIHGCIEGPETGVYYRGIGNLKGGTETVSLPHYFEALVRKENRTAYLTPVGNEPYLLSVSDVIGGSFNVFGTKPDGKFSWQVMGERADVDKLNCEVPA